MSLSVKATRVSPCHSEEVEGQLRDVEGEMLMRGLHENLRPSGLAADILSLFERAERGKDDSAPLLLGRGVGPAVVRQRRRVQQEVDGRHVDFDELLLQVGKVLLQTHSEKRKTDGSDLHSHRGCRRQRSLSRKRPLLFKSHIARRPSELCSW